MVKRKVFLASIKHQYHVSQCGKLDCSAQSQKEWRLLQKSKFDLFIGWILILLKMVERKHFLANSKHQYRVSKWSEHDCSASNKKNGDYYKYPSPYHFIDELWL